MPQIKTHDTTLSLSLWNQTFANPIGLAAGFDKDGRALRGLAKAGFGFLEAGTVTPQPQPGNPKPRVFRDTENQAVINRLGFPSRGMDVFKANMTQILPLPCPLGLNLGKNKDTQNAADDYCLLVKELGPHADYLTINISSPNTPGLRDLQKREPLLDLLDQVMQARSTLNRSPPPLLIKLAPDLNREQITDLANTLSEAKIDGIILTNTTLERPHILPASFAAEAGGLSGAPLTRQSTEIIRAFYEETGGTIPIIGVGGIFTAKDAYNKIKAGASLLQIYTSFVYKGPSVVKSLCNGLSDYLKRDGYGAISDAIGTETSINKKAKNGEEKDQSKKENLVAKK